MRIVSLLPSATETVCALGKGDELVGRSAECDYPAEVKHLPVVMRPRSLDAEASSGEIDRRVRAQLAREESLYEIDLEHLGSLRPEVILTQDLCRVCSVTTQEVEEACHRVGVHPIVVTLGGTTLAGVWNDVLEVGRAIGATPTANRLVATLRDRTVLAPGLPPDSRPRVAVVEWLDPPILSGLWTPELVKIAGGQPVGPRGGERAETTSWEGIWEASPDLVVCSPCSFPIARTRQELSRLAVPSPSPENRPRFGAWIADEAYFSRPGPRLADGADLLRHLLGDRSVAPGPMPFERWRFAPLPEAPWPTG